MNANQRERPTNADFFQGDIRAGLEKIRLRLLDLTNRNRLLNFRHRERSRSMLRVVDEAPDQIFSVLLDGRSMRFRPIPQARRRDWVLDEPEKVGDHLAPAQPNESARFRPPTAKEYAEKIGLPTSFDLPAHAHSNADNVHGRHVGKEIQTLHFPEDLEAVLRSISGAARLAIEETGTNMLYLAMGFLEWYESEASQQTRFAPLVLLPVTVDRGAPDPQTHVYRYSVQHSGEDVLANISLQEKMRRDFSLDFPDFDQEGSAPEEYFQIIDRIVRRQDRWRVRRQITLTLLAFGKLLMYRDLDPDTWPPGKRPENHGRLREFFEGVQHTEIGIAPDYPLDSAEMRGRVPPIIDDADASQHSALVDAVEGKNLVIQGPPGTGKSQTITNLIAAAMAAGKSVLFVSEKLAALEVVRHRLNRAKLGTFCLELHSHKTQKRALIEDIKERIEAHGHFREPEKLRALQEFNETTKRQLIAYAELANSQLGRLGKTVHEVLWWCRRSRTTLVNPEALDHFALKNATAITSTEAEQRRQVLRALSRHLARVSSTGAVSEHPWFGVTNSELNYLAADGIVAAVEGVRDHSDLLLEWGTEVESTTGAKIPANVAAAVGFAAAVGRLPAPPADVLSEIVPALADPAVARHLEEFGRRLREYRARRSSVVASLGSVPRWDNATGKVLCEAANTLLGSVAGNRSIEEERGVIVRLTEATRAIADARVVVEQLSDSVDEPVAFTPASLPWIADALTSVADAPVEWLHLRHEGLEAPSAVGALEAASREVTPLIARRDRLSQRFHLELMPEPAVLREHAATAAASHWWSFVDPKYRAARGAYFAMYRGPAKPKRANLRSDLRELAAFQAKLHAFAANGPYREASGVHSAGIDTPFSGLLALARWHTKTATRLSGAPESRALAGALWHADGDRIRRLATDVGSTGNLTTLVAAADLGVRTASELLAAEHALPQDTDLGEFSGQLAVSCDRLQTALDQLSSAGVPAATQLGHVQQRVESVLQVHALWNSLARDEVASRVLGEHLRDAVNDFRPVLATLTFYANLVASDLVPEVKVWLLEGRTLDRLGRLRDLGEAAGANAEQFTAAWNRFSTLAAADAAEWFNESESVRDIDLRVIQARAVRALDGSDRLSEWLDYLQARNAGRTAHLNVIADAGEAGVVPAGQLVTAFDFILANSLVRAAFRDQPGLVQFSGLTHEQLRTRFAEVDREIIALERQRVAAVLDRRPVPMGIGTGPVRQYTEYCLLEREMGKQKRHVPIRQLMVRAGKALQALKPCFMMGPLSVAQYLPAGQLEFDLLVMDEASQLKPEDALGAICRAKQVVIVGDPMQLPPTSFFERVAEDEEEEQEDEAQALADAESILDVASHLYRPARMLRWHYRSRHGSLIAFSNKEFYRENLIVFPSPVARGPEFGVKFVHVPDGVYENRRNVVEARAVVDRVFKHMRRSPEDSLGIATMNTTQRDVIANEIEERLKSDPAAQAYLERHQDGLEPLFIKNLENVQGDERAVIYVSVTYGPNERGAVYQRFGPINGATGHRRLNVLFTRARKRLVVFSSMVADQIRVEPKSRWGVKALKGYLAYAETGILEQATFTGREPDSDFEVEVASALRSKGFDAVAQLGVAGFFLDLAVKHPYRPDSFILGIECDGASYHSSRSARDRDRLRQQILEDLGWKIHRIWSTDWFKNPRSEIERLVKKIEQLAGEPPEQSTVEAVPGAAEQIEEAASEAVLPPLSVEDARAELVRLREDVVKPTYPHARADECILRDEMISAFLARRPHDHSDWIDRMSIDLRLATSFPQTEFLDAIFAILGRIRN